MKKITLITGLLLLAQFAKAQDTCASALPITVAGQYIVGPVNGTQVPSPICAENGSGATAGEWYAYTPTADYTVTVTSDLQINSGKDTRLHVYTGTCGTLACYSGDDDAGNIGNGYLSVATFNVTAGTTYYLAWDNKWNSAGFTFALLENPVVIPPPTPISYTAQNIATINSSYNICVVDMNGDHLDDIVGVSANTLKIHFQNADGTFTIATFPIAGNSNMPTWSLAAGDYNKDGFNDLLLGNNNGLTFWKSNSTGTAYTSVTPGQYIFCQRTNFVDLNNDGNLDAFSCHDVDPNVYYLNNGSGGFVYYQSGTTPGAYSLGITPSGGNYASLWTDFDNDGDVDMFISKCSGPPCELHRNDGNGVFTDISALAGINLTPIQSWSSAISDFDNDGDMDIMIGSNGSVGNKFFRNNLDGNTVITTAFTDITAGSGWDTNTAINRDYIAYDFDNDGKVDVMGSGNKIMFNQGGNVFEPFSYPAISVGAVGDLNNDGFLDILNNGTIRYAVPNGNNWLKVGLKGLESNINGIAARVELYGAFGKQIRDIRSGEGFEYMSSLNAHFGIGAETEITKLVVKWPSGKVDVINNPAINSMVIVTEGAFPLNVGGADDSIFAVYPNPAKDVLNIETKAGMTLASAEIFDLGGKSVGKKAVANKTVSVSGLASGTYLLILQDTEGKKHTQKFIKS